MTSTWFDAAFHLQPGAHPVRDDGGVDGMCAMEMVAWLAGEDHTDEPRCACPVLGAVVRKLNDTLALPERVRTLRPLVPHLVNSRSTAVIERRRALTLVDCMVREVTPARLRSAGREADAAALARLDSMVDSEDALRQAAAWVRAVVPDDKPLNWLLKRAMSKDKPVAWVAAVAPPSPWHGALVRAVRALLVSRPVCLGHPDLIERASP